jgi:hypothetical protein
VPRVPLSSQREYQLRLQSLLSVLDSQSTWVRAGEEIYFEFTLGAKTLRSLTMLYFGDECIMMSSIEIESFLAIVRGIW